MGFITLLTDFGLKDGNVGVMKGTIWRISPEAQLVDLSHLITPQNILEGALILGRSAPFFPVGTIHVAVVDPGVGTGRRPIAARLGSQFFVGPDNGLLTRLLARAEREGDTIEIVHLDRPAFWLPQVSFVFHGRDIFAPVAAHLDTGVGLDEVGTFIQDPVRLKIPSPEIIPTGLSAEIIHIDHFGNLTTSVHHLDVGQHTRLSVKIGDTHITDLVRTFGERPQGTLIALYGSSGDLIISEVNGNAARRLDAGLGDPVEIIWD